MRAYVIRGKNVGVGASETICVTSSKKLAIKACEDYLNDSGTEHIDWEEKEKHQGYAYAGTVYAGYEMFFVNQTETAE